MEDYEQLEFKYSSNNRFQRFENLMLHRVEQVLLVASLYDFFTLSEDGALYESIYNEYKDLGLSRVPRITRVSGEKEALALLARQPKRFDLVIISMHLAEQSANQIGESIKQQSPDLPVVLLTWDNRRSTRKISEREGSSVFDKVFVWQGDFRIFLAIVKHMEDVLNVENDTKEIGVQSVILVEDDLRFYSSFLPIIYKEIVQLTHKLISEGVNQAHRQLRMRARPKILLCTTYEEAWKVFERYYSNILGVISDIKFPRKGELDPDAGFALARNIRKVDDSIPVLLQSSNIDNQQRAESLDCPFLLKGSDVLLHDLRMFMIYNMGFGDFVFRMPDGSIVGQAKDSRELLEQLQIVPDESVNYHASRHHFSKWLKARTEHVIATRMRAHRFINYDSFEDGKDGLIAILRGHLRELQRGSIVDFDPHTFDPKCSFARIGGGSLGGKGRGLGFVNSLVGRYDLEDRFDELKISVPPTVVIGTDVFDWFLDDNDLRSFALRAENDDEILARFLESDLRSWVVDMLREFLNLVSYPLSIRSSSLLEDSQEVPFAGVYATYMLCNSSFNAEVSLNHLIDAIKRVYASTFSTRAKMYIGSTPYRLEEEKMAVIIQKLAGARHQNLFYPSFSGVARSYNYYPIAPMKAEDGIASVALGFGKAVVEGGPTVRFSPRYPKHLVQFSSVDDILDFSQRDFYALAFPDTEASDSHSTEMKLMKLGVSQVNAPEILQELCSTYNRDNHVIYDSVDREGSIVVTFAPILKYESFPLPEILEMLLELGEYGMNSATEIEFAVNLSVPEGTPKEFYILQMRPMVKNQESEEIDNILIRREDVVVASDTVLGNGIVDDIFDIVAVDAQRYQRSLSKEVAREVGSVNLKLLEQGKPFLLIGPGRWGSTDPWLGIPVKWDDISGAKVIVETPMEDLKVTPSQGTHFFHNLTSLRIGYFTIKGRSKSDSVAWDWLSAHNVEYEKGCVSHISLSAPLSVIMNGHKGEGYILKPDSGFIHS